MQDLPPADPRPEPAVEPKHHHRLVSVIVLFVILIAVVIAYTLVSNQPAEPTNHVEDQTPTVKDDQPQATQPPSSSVEQIKMAVIEGRISEVPENVGMSRIEIIRKYLYECSLIKDLELLYLCYERYYYNNDAEAKRLKDNCEQSTQKQACMDEYYHYLASMYKATICNKISEQSLRETCVNEVK